MATEIVDKRGRVAMVSPDGGIEWIEDQNFIHATRLDYRPAVWDEVKAWHDSTTSSTADAVASGFARSATFGLKDHVLAKFFPEQHERFRVAEQAHPTATAIGSVAGFVGNPAFAGAKVATRVGARALGKAGLSAPASVAASRIASEAVAGAAIAAGTASGEIEMHGQHLSAKQRSEVIKQATMEGAFLSAGALLAAGGVRHLLRGKLAKTREVLIKADASRQAAISNLGAVKKSVGFLDEVVAGTPVPRRVAAAKKVAETAQRKYYSAEAGVLAEMTKRSARAEKKTIRSGVARYLLRYAGGALGGSAGAWAGREVSGSTGGSGVGGFVGAAAGYQAAARGGSRIGTVLRLLGLGTAKALGSRPFRGAVTIYNNKQISDIAADAAEMDPSRIAFSKEVSPTVKLAAQNMAASGAAMIAQAAPRSDGRPGWRPSKKQRREFSELVHAIKDTEGLVTHIVSGNAPARHVAILKQLSPPLFSKLILIAKQTGDWRLLYTLTQDPNLLPLLRSGSMQKRLQSLRVPDQAQMDGPQMKSGIHSTQSQGMNERLNS